MSSLFYTLQFSKIGSIISIMQLNLKLEMSRNLAEVVFIMWLWQDSNSGLTWYKWFYSFHYPMLLLPQKNGATRSRRPAAYRLPIFLPPRTSSYHQYEPDICMNRKKNLCPWFFPPPLPHPVRQNTPIDVRSDSEMEDFGKIEILIHRSMNTKISFNDHEEPPSLPSGEIEAFCCLVEL